MGVRVTVLVPVLPEPIALAKNAGLKVFGAPFSANLIVIRGPGQPGDWDGQLTLSWVETPGGAWRSVSAPCATRPGKHYLQNPMNPRGTAVLQPGQFRGSHARGFHHAGTAKASAAWVQVGEVVVRRDGDRDEVLDALSAPLTDGSAINVHRVSDPNYLAGCIGVEAGPLDEMLEAFDWLAAKYRQPTVSLSVVEQG
jgi:hypothetical protein